MTSASMQCPKCNCEFEEVVFASVAVLRCTGCRGIWFPQARHEELKSVGGAEALDDGNRQLGRRLNDKVAFACPECGAAMIRMSDPAQHHLWYESCSQCFGVFFDAGEFRDYRERTVLDAVRDLMAPERR